VFGAKRRIPLLPIDWPAGPQTVKVYQRSNKPNHPPASLSANDSFLGRSALTAHDDFGEIIDHVRSSEHSFNPQPTARNLNKPTSTLCQGRKRRRSHRGIWRSGSWWDIGTWTVLTADIDWVCYRADELLRLVAQRASLSLTSGFNKNPSRPIERRFEMNPLAHGHPSCFRGFPQVKTLSKLSKQDGQRNCFNRCELYPDI
jgi:hypothetical protein